MTVFELDAVLNLNTTGYTEGLDTAEKNANSFGSTARSVFGGNLLYNAVARATGAVIDFGKDTVSAGMDFDKAMAQVAATSGQSVEDIGQLRDFAQEMGRTTAFSATEAAEGLNYMALAGYDADEAMATLPTVLNLAAAGNIDLAYASDMVTDAMSALGLDVEDASMMVDQMAAASANSNTSVSQLGDAFLTIGATARNMQGGTQELATVLGVLADNGIKGAEGGTHLRNMILSLQNPTDEAAQILNDLGVSVYDADGNMRSLVDIVGDMQTATEDMDAASRDAIISGIFNKTDLASVNALLGTSKERFDELGEAIDGSAGAAERMANTQLDNLAGDVTLFQSALEGARIALSDSLTPSLREFVQFGTDALSNITKAFQEDGLQGAMTEVGNAIVGIGDMINDALPTITQAAVDLFSAVVSGVADNAGDLADTAASIIVTLIDGAGEMMPKIIEAGVTLLTSLVSGLTENLDTIIPSITNAVITIFDSLPDLLPDLIEAATQLVLGLVEELPTMFVSIAEAIPPLIEGLTSALPQMIASIGTIMTAIGEALPDLIVGLTSAGVEGLSTLVTAIISNLPSLLETALTGIGSIVGGLLEGIFTGVDVAAAKLFNDTDWLNAYQAEQDALAIQRSVENIAKAVDDLSEKHVGDIFDVETQAATYQTYIDRFHTLVDSQGRIQEGYESEVSQLLDLLGIDAEVRDGQVQNISDVETQMNTLIETYKKEAYTQVELAQQTSWLEKRREAAAEFDAALKLAQESQEKAAEYEPGTDEYINYMDAAGEAMQAAADAAGVIAEADANIALSDQNLAAIAEEDWASIKSSISEAGIDIPNILDGTINPSFADLKTAIQDALNGEYVGAAGADFDAALESILKDAGYTVDEETGLIVESVNESMQEVAEAPTTADISGSWQDAIGQMSSSLLDTLLSEEAGMAEVGIKIPEDIAANITEHGYTASDAIEALVALMNNQYQLDGLSEETRTTLENILGIVDEQAPDIGGKVASHIADKEQAVKQAAAQVSRGAIDGFSGLANGLQGESDNGVLKVRNSFTSGKEGAGQDAKDFKDKIFGEISPLSGDMETTGDTAGSNLDSSFGKWQSTVSNTVKTIYNLFHDQLGTNLPPMMTQWGSEAGQWYNNGMQSYVGAIMGTVQQIVLTITNAFSPLPQQLSYVGQSSGTSLINAIVYATSGMYSEMYSVGYNAGQGMFDGISAWEGALAQKAANMAASAANAARQNLRVSSPSKVMREIFGYAGEGMYLGLEDWENAVVGEAKFISDGITQELDSSDLLGEYNGNIESSVAVNTTNDTDQQLLMLLRMYLPQLANMQIVMDGEKTVGALMPRIDKEYGRMDTMMERGVNYA